MEKETTANNKDENEDMIDNSRIIELLDSLEDMGIVIPEGDIDTFCNIVDLGVESIRFRDLIASFINELSEDTVVNTQKETQFSADVNNFIMNFTGYPYKWDESSLTNFESKLQLIEILKAEVQAKRMIIAQSPAAMDTGAKPRTEKEVKMNSLIRQTAKLLQLQPSEDNTQTLKDIHTKINELLKRVPKNYIGKPLIPYNFTPQQMKLLEQINADLKVDYEQRKQLLLKRLEVTLQSFHWSEKGQNNKEEMDHIIQQHQKILNHTTDITAYEAFTVRPDALKITKTSDASIVKDSQSSLKTMKIVGEVPDRGGRIGMRRKEEAKEPASSAPLPQRAQGRAKSWQSNDARYSKKSSGKGRGGWSNKRGRGGSGYY